MTGRRPCPAAPGRLEDYAARFDDLFGRLAQRRRFREYLAGLPAARDQNTTLTVVAGAEPVTGAQHRSVQRLQFFLSESRWDPEAVNARRLELLLLADPATAPHDAGMLMIDDSGDRRDGTKTAHWAIRGWAGTARPATGRSPSPRCGPASGCIIRWTRCRTPRRSTSRREERPGVPDQAGDRRGLGVRARAARFAFLAVCADSAYGDQDGFRGELVQAGLPFVMALKPRCGTWAYGPDAHTPVDAARALAWDGPEDPGDWRPVIRAFRGGHTETWYAADARLGWRGRTAPRAWWWLPPTRAPCRARPPDSWPPTCPGPAARPRTSPPRSASAGPPGSATAPHRPSLGHRGRNPAAERGPQHCRTAAGADPAAGAARGAPGFPWIALQRW